MATIAAAGSSLAAAFSYAGIASGVAFPASLPQYGQMSRSGADATPQCEQGAASHTIGRLRHAASSRAIQTGRLSMQV